MRLYKETHEPTQEKLRQAVSDVQKANGSVERLQADLDALRAKMRSSAAVIIKQESVVSQQSEALLSTKQQLDSIMADVKKGEAERAELQDNLKKAREQLDDSQKQLVSNGKGNAVWYWRLIYWRCCCCVWVVGDHC